MYSMSGNWNFLSVASRKWMLMIGRNIPIIEGTLKVMMSYNGSGKYAPPLCWELTDNRRYGLGMRRRNHDCCNLPLGLHGFQSMDLKIYKGVMDLDVLPSKKLVTSDNFPKLILGMSLCT